MGAYKHIKQLHIARSKDYTGIELVDLSGLKVGIRREEMLSMLAISDNYYN